MLCAWPQGEEYRSCREHEVHLKCPPRFVHNFCVPNSLLTIKFCDRVYDLYSLCVSLLTSVILFITGTPQNNVWCMKRFANNEREKEYK